MKKKYNKGFMLTETLIVATLLITVLLFMYIQFKNVKRSYDRSFKYDTINDIYALNNIKNYIEQENYAVMANSLKNTNYIELDKCQTAYFNIKLYCEELFKNLGVKKLYLTKQNIQALKNKNNLDSETNDFLNLIDYNNDSGYRLLAKFKDNTYSSLKILSDKKHLSLINNSCDNNNEHTYTIYHQLEETNEDIYTPTINKAGCGSVIKVEDQVNTSDACIYNTSMSKDEINVGLEDSNNNATIKYKRYKSTVIINYYQKDTTTKLYTSMYDVVTCGDNIDVTNYIQKIDGKEYVSASINNFKATKNNVYVNLYYVNTADAPANK